MTRDQAAECIEHLAELFPQSDLQPAELNLLLNALRKFDFAMVISVVDEHRLHNDFSRPKISQILREAEQRHVAAHGRKGDKALRETRHADLLRAIWRETDQRVDSWGDAQVYLTFHAQQARRGLAEHGLSDGYRAKIRRECVRDLVLAGVHPEVAPRFADAILDPNLTREAFGQLIDDLNNATALAGGLPV